MIYTTVQQNHQAQVHGMNFYYTPIWKQFNRGHIIDIFLCSVSKHTRGMLLKGKSADKATLPSTVVSLPPDSLNVELYQPPWPISSRQRHCVFSLLFSAVDFGSCCERLVSVALHPINALHIRGDLTQPGYSARVGFITWWNARRRGSPVLKGHWLLFPGVSLKTWAVVLDLNSSWGGHCSRRGEA